MRKIYRLLFIILFMAVGLLMLSPVANASSATTKTYTLDYKGNMVSTQDAYLPMNTYTTFGLDEATEMTLGKDNTLYISDTGNKELVIVDTTSGTLKSRVSEFTYVGPTFIDGSTNETVTSGSTLKINRPEGLYYRAFKTEMYGIDFGEFLFLCDSNASRVYVINVNNLNVVHVFTKPSSVLFSDRSFEPQKIAVDNGGNLYIIGGGINEGIMQLSIEGEFLGYFATNKVNLSVQERLQDTFYTEEQKAQLPAKNPPVFTNIFADEEGLVFTTTQSKVSYPYIQKHNTAGENQFTKYRLVADGSLIDITTDKNGIVYALSKGTGKIYVYTQQGEFIYSFAGGGDINTPDISGIFNQATSIIVDDNLNVWVLDKATGIVQTFSPTEYASTIYSALNAYLRSDYTESINLWETVLELNQMSNLAHNNIGLNYLYNQEYELAMYHLKISNNKTDYSSAYWEVRNIWLQANLTWIISTLLIVVVAYQVIKRLNKKYHFLDPVSLFITRVKNIPIIKEVFDVFHIARHPEVGFYDLKTGKKGSLRGAYLLLGTLFIVYLFYITSKGFIYQYTELADIDFLSVVIGFFSIIFVFVLSNYLVVSIMDGMGGFKEIFKLVMYSIAPLLIGFVIIILFSHVMTESEAFFLKLTLYVSVIYSVILMFMGMMEMQGYTFRQLLASILLTIVLMLVFILVLLIIFVLSKQLLNFLQLFLREVLRNATN